MPVSVKQLDAEIDELRRDQALIERVGRRHKKQGAPYERLAK